VVGQFFPLPMAFVRFSNRELGVLFHDANVNYGKTDMEISESAFYVFFKVFIGISPVNICSYQLNFDSRSMYCMIRFN